MKKAFISVLIFYLAFHFVFPEIYFLYFGDVTIYSELFDSAAATKVLLLNVVTICIVILVVGLLPLGNFKIEPVISSGEATQFSALSIIFGAYLIFYSGGFLGVISGTMSGELLNYINIFLNLPTLLMCALFLQGERKTPAILLIVLYVIVNTVGGSRGAIVSIALIFVYGFSYKSFDLHRRDIFRFLKYLLLASPVVFYFATKIRDPNLEFDLHNLADQIVGRVSAIELGMIPVYHIDDGAADLSLFYEKYSFLNQIKLILDSMIPGQIFEFDVMPNNYFRAIFFGYSNEYVFENYQSINITFPVYLYAYFGWWAIPVGSSFLVSYFLLIRALKSSPYIGLILISTLYQILIYFDWVMIFTQVYSGLLTVLTLKTYIAVKAAYEKNWPRGNVAKLP